MGYFQEGMLLKHNSIVNFFEALDTIQRIVFESYWNADYLDSLYDADLYQARMYLFSQMQAVRQNSPALVSAFVTLYEMIFALTYLNRRRKDHALLETCHSELMQLSNQISLILQALAKNQLAEVTAFSESIESLDSLYRHTLQVVSADPLVMLFFIQNVYLLRDAFASLPDQLMACSVSRFRFRCPAWGVQLGRKMLELIHHIKRNPYRDFRKALLPTMNTMYSYFNSILQTLLNGASTDLQSEMEKKLMTSPGWVYSQDFNARLQAGHRFFLMRVEQLADSLFSIDYLAKHVIDKRMVEPMCESLQTCVERINTFFLAIIRVMDGKALMEGLDYVSNEMTVLENQCWATVPTQLDQLQFSTEAMGLVEFVYHVKDVGHILLNIAETLR